MINAQKKSRRVRKLLTARDDMQALSDEMRGKTSIESAIGRITETLLFLLEEKCQAKH